MNNRDIVFSGKNNPRLENGALGFDWCDRCGAHTPSLLVINTKADCFRLCKKCILEGIEIMDKTILQDCVDRGRYLQNHGRQPNL